MQKLNYGLIISDFDGTLVREDGTISQKNKRAIQKYTQNGGCFAVSTGRLHYGILPRVKELGLDGVVCCCQGAVIIDIASGKPILDGKLSYETTLRACMEMEKLGLHIHLYGFDCYYSNMDDQALKSYEKAVRVKAQVVTDKPLSKLVEERRICAYKILAMVAPEDSAKIIKSLSKTHYEDACITKSADFLVEIINKKYSKGTAVQFLSDYYKVPLEKTIGIGDQMNDIPMIEKAGLGVAVQNADDGLKQVADTVCEYTNEEDAVASIIEKYGFMEK